MLRTIICAICALIISIGCYGQKGTPKYILKDIQPANGGVGFYGYDSLFAPKKIQTIYKPSSFPGMPSGTVTNIYLRWQMSSPPPTPWNALRIGLKGTSLSAFPGTYPYDTFEKMESYVVNKPSFAITDTIKLGDWIKIPLTEGSFYYNNTQNFVMELAFGRYPATPKQSKLLFTSSVNVTYLCNLVGFRDSSYSNAGFEDYGLLDIGFDLATTGIEAEGIITSFGLSPNPATDGRFNVSFDTKQPVKEASVTVTDALGRAAYYRSYGNVGTSFFKEVDMSGAAKGIYFVKVAADGAAISRRVVIE